MYLNIKKEVVQISCIEETIFKLDFHLILNFPFYFLMLKRNVKNKTEN